MDWRGPLESDQEHPLRSGHCDDRVSGAAFVQARLDAADQRQLRNRHITLLRNRPFSHVLMCHNMCNSLMLLSTIY